MRWSEPAPAERFRAALAGLHVSGASAYDNVSVAVGSAHGRRVDKHIFHRANRRVFRSVSLHRVFEAALLALAAHGRAPSPAGSVELAATVVLGPDGDAVLLDRDTAWMVDDVAPQLARAGHRVVDTSVVRVRLSDLTIELGVEPSLAARLGNWAGSDDGRADRFAADSSEDVEGATVRRLLVDPFRVGLGRDLSPQVAGLSLLDSPAASSDVVGYADACRELVTTIVGGRAGLTSLFAE